MLRIFFTALIITIPFLSISQGWRRAEMEILVKTGRATDFANLSAITRNLEPASRDGSMVRAYVIPDELDRIREKGFEYTVTIPDLNRHYENFWDNPLVPPGYYTYEQIIAIADSLATNFPNICVKENWGTSLGGRQLAALKISDNPLVDEPEAEIMYDGGIHGDEVGGSQNVIMFARDLCKGYGTDPQITDLVNNREIWLYLMVNPDGRASMSRYNNNGVDCNRDNGYMWDGEGFSPSAFSQVETRALRDGILRNQFVVYTNFHSGIEIISYPWSYRADNPRDFQHIHSMAGVYSSSSGYAGGLQYGQGYNIMYAINGSTKDFVYGSLGQVGWSIEISADKQPPSSQIYHYYILNKPAMLEVISRCGWGASGTITDSLTGEPVRATVWINDLFPVYTDPVVGDYHKYLVPGGNYTLKVTAPGYKSKTVSGITVPATGSVVTDLQLAPDTGWFAYKVVSCRIPGNNFGDEGFTPGCLGVADNIPYSIGRNGWVIVDMGDTLYDGPGDDIRVFQSGSTPKNFTLSGGNSPDGPFTTIGTGTGTASFNLGSTTLGKARYIQVKDNASSPGSGVGAGYNLDAVAMLTPPLKVKFTVSNSTPCSGTAIDFTDQSAGNPVAWNWSFPGGIPSSSTLQHPTGIIYPASGSYPVTLTISNGVSSLGKTFNGFINVTGSPSVSLGNDTTLCDYQSLTLSAGNPGYSYFWSTGATTQSIVVDSAGTGYGTASYWVEVTGMNGCKGADTIDVTFDNCTGTDPLAGIPDVLLSPNPTSGRLSVKTTAGACDRLIVYSTIGQMIRQYRLNGENETVIDLSDLAPGLYLCQFVFSNGTMTRQNLVITR